MKTLSQASTCKDIFFKFKASQSAGLNQSSKETTRSIIENTDNGLRQGQGWCKSSSQMAILVVAVNKAVLNWYCNANFRSWFLF